MTQQRNPEKLTKAVTHIRLIEVNPGKLAALDDLAPVFLSLCQQYVTLFCTVEQPDKFHPPIFATPLSERWHRVAIQQHVRQEINWAVNQCFTEHSDAQFAYEQLSVATMKHKARAMNAYMHASNLAHLPKQIAWNAAKRGIRATRVKSAYSSQECSVCYHTGRANRPDQQTFCCQVCGYQAHADFNAAMNIARRVGDT